MNRKVAIILAVLAFILLSGIGAGVYFLYHGSSSQGYDSRSGLFAAVPPDAVAVIYVNDLQTLALMSDDNGMLGAGGKFSEFLSAVAGDVRARRINAVKGAETVLSYHYDGRLVPLLSINVAKAGSSADCKALCSLADSLGIYASEIDCSSVALSGTYLSKRRILLVSTSELLINSSSRHVSEGVSILSQKGFSEITSSVQGGKGQIYLNGKGLSKLFSGILTKEYAGYSGFCSGISSWTGMSLDSVNPAHAVLSGRFAESSGYEEYARVYKNLSPERAMIGEIVPAGTLSAFSQPMGDVSQAVSAYAKFADSRIGKAEYESSLSTLEKRAGLSPSKWARLLDLKEVAVASIPVGDKIGRVLLLRMGKADLQSVFKDESRDFAYSGFASALFGKLFSAGDESRYTVAGRWIVAGSEAAVSEYVSGKALEATLADYMGESGCGGRLDSRDVNFMAYSSLKKIEAGKIFQKQYASCMKEALKEADYVPLVLKVAQGRGEGVALTLTADRIFAPAVVLAAPAAPSAPEVPVVPAEPAKPAKAAEPAREKPAVQPASPSVEVPSGPFKVKNSYTGKMNSFYQDGSLNVCLKDEKGVQQWKVAIGKPICGNAGTIDYYNNKKLQILFAAGSKIYLLDRLGRHVKGFPIDLGKEILLGPDIYDFNNFKKYNVVVLHADNTVEMYNLKGQKHAQWKGIHPSEPVAALPELMKEGGKSYWIVKTASGHEITYPFYGGEPVKIE